MRAPRASSTATDRGGKVRFGWCGKVRFGWCSKVRFSVRFNRRHDSRFSANNDLMLQQFGVTLVNEQ